MTHVFVDTAWYTPQLALLAQQSELRFLAREKASELYSVPAGSAVTYH